MSLSQTSSIYVAFLFLEAQDGLPDEYIRFPVGRDTVMKIMNEKCIDGVSLMDWFDDMIAEEIY